MCKLFMLMNEATFLQRGLLLSSSEAELPWRDLCHLCLGKGLRDCSRTQEGEELAYVAHKHAQMCYEAVITSS